jgi:hypothetical protein
MDPPPESTKLASNLERVALGFGHGVMPALTSIFRQRKMCSMN